MINILDVFPTDYDDESCWLEYETDKGLGYEIVDKSQLLGQEYFQFLLNGNKAFVTSLVNKPLLSSIENDYIRNLIENCRDSENDMWYVDYDDEEFLELKKDKVFMENLYKTLENPIFDNVIELDEDNSLGDGFIIVYGGVITRFIFD